MKVSDQQAIAARFSDKNYAYPVKAADGAKVFRGIYDSSNTRSVKEKSLFFGCYSLESDQTFRKASILNYTALDLYGFSAYTPSKLHLIVPKQFRRMAKIPDTLVLHKEMLHPEEVVMKQGYKVTTPLRTLIDVIEDGVLADDLLMQAVQDAP